MAGNAKTGNFFLSTATVMIGPKADLYKLNTDAHSIGLVKNFAMQTDPQFLELTQGIANDVVASAKTAHGASASMEVYEYTLRNLAYAAGIDGSGASFDVSPGVIGLTDAALAAAATTITVGSDITTGLSSGDYIYIQKGDDDYVHIAKLSANPTFATAKTTLTFAGFPVPVGMTFPIGSRVGKLRAVDVGGNSLQAELAAKVVGVTPKDKKPFIILFPKVKITQGLNLSFASDNWSNMPFGFTPYVLTADEPLYSDFGDKVARILAAA